MRWAEIESDWDAFSIQVQDRWGRLTEGDLLAARESAEVLLNFVVERYGIDRALAKRHVDDWINSAPDLSRAIAPGSLHIEIAAAGRDHPGA
ncbi:MAG: CsbD family protein [Proteobacteria bacterium]|nr:CsbD family protein [Pseudomonadota bacterium]